MYGHFIILVCLGVGVTIWYTFTPGLEHVAPASMLRSIDDYNTFLNMDRCNSSFKRMGFVETHDLSSEIESALANVPPLSSIKIPAGGSVLTAVGLGLMLGIFLSIGIIPLPADGLTIEN